MSDSKANVREFKQKEFRSEAEAELIEQLLDPKVQESLSVLVKELPNLTELVTVLSKGYGTIQSLMTDDVLKGETLGAISEIAKPVKNTVKNVAQTVIEAKDEAEKSDEVIGIFGLIKMLKDPQAQKMFRFVDAYLKVSAKRND